MRIGRILLGVLVVGLVAIQFVPVSRSNPPVASEVPAPDAVRAILERGCYDCHSNETKWRWYSYVAPISWLVEHDVEEGRHELNFSDWESMKPEKRQKKLREVIEEVEGGFMPPKTYRWIHGDAVPTQQEIDVLRAWAEGAAGS